jgi:hypothetical protein
MHTIRAGTKRRSRGLAFLLLALAGLLAIPLAGCDSYNLSFKDFYEGEDGKDPSAKAITGFTIPSLGTAGVINETLKTIAVKVPSGTVVGSRIPVITHTGVSVSPASGAAQDFSGPVTYTVTAADGTAAAYTVTVFPVVPPADITAYLNNYTGPEPVPLAVDITLSPTGWSDLLGQIAAASPPKSVALDLSGCVPGTHSTGGGLYGDGTFDPDYTNTSAAKGRIVSLTLPEGATDIAAGTSSNPAFKNFTALQTVSLPAVTGIGNYAFYDCTALETISLPAVTGIGNYAFSHCTALETISLPAATSIGDLAFYDCTALETISLPAATSIGDSAFFRCALTTVSLPAVTGIGNYAFYYCTALETISLPAATSIGYYAFSNTALSSVSLPAAYSISGYAFFDCTALSSVSLPAATDILGNAFRGCTALETVSLPAATNINAAVFQETGSQSLTITLPQVAPSVTFTYSNTATAFTKYVTIQTPAGRTGYDTTWQDDFKKAFGVSYGGNFVTIHLSFTDL